MTPRNRYIDVLSVLLVLAAFSFIWRVRTSFFIPVPEPFEILIFAIGCALTVGFLCSSLPRLGEFVANIEEYRLILIVILAAPLLGLLGSSLAGFGWLEYAREVAKEYARLLAGVFFFVAAAYIVFVRPHIVKLVLAAIAVSPLPLWLALIPSWQSFFLHTNRLRGAGNDPNHLAMWIAIGLAASVVFFLWEQSKVRWLWLGNGLLIAPFLLWAASRAVWFAAAIVLFAAGIFFLAEKLSRERLRLLLTVFLGLMVSLVIGFLLFPIPSRAAIATRAVSFFASGEKLSTIVSLATGGAGFSPSDVSTTNAIEKMRLWSDGAKRFLRSPLGFGPAYYFWNPVDIMKASGHKLDVHSLWLGIGLSSGWLGFGAWILFIAILGRKAIRLARDCQPGLLALAFSFFTILFVGFFSDIFTLIWLWLIIGLVAGCLVADKPPTVAVYEKQKTQSDFLG